MTGQKGACVLSEKNVMERWTEVVSPLDMVYGLYGFGRVEWGGSDAGIES